MVGTAAFRNSSAAVSSPGVPGAHCAPAAPSGHGGCTIESTICGGVLASSALSLAMELEGTAEQPLSRVPAGIACPSMYGAAAGWARALANVDPESSISQTFVTGGSVFGGATAPVGLDDGADSAGVGLGVADVDVPGGRAGAARAGFERTGDGVLCEVTAGGCAAVVLYGPPTPAAASSDGTSSGMREAPAKDVLGAGPIAAPT